MLKEYSSLSEVAFNQVLVETNGQKTEPQPAMRLHLEGAPPWLHVGGLHFPDKEMEKSSPSAPAPADNKNLQEKAISMKLMVTGDQLNLLYKHVTAT